MISAIHWRTTWVRVVSVKTVKVFDTQPDVACIGTLLKRRVGVSGM
jgi:hypothetical protein